MIKNYLKTAWRNLAKNKTTSLINTCGLSVGIAIALLNGLWIWDELSFNQYHRNYDRIAQVMTGGIDQHDGPYVNNSLPYPLATELQANYNSNFSHLIRASWVQEYILTAGEQKLSRKGQFMDEGAPDMLTLKMVAGTHAGLHDPHSIMLAASVAKALFGNADPMGQVVTLNNKTSVTVAGVYEDLPLNTQFKDIKFLSTWDLWISENPWIQQRAMTDWKNHFIKLYAAIKPGMDFTTINNNIKEAELKNIRGLENLQEEAARQPHVFLYPMSRWHLYSPKAGATNNQPVRMAWLIGIIGLFVLLLACINFMNLSTAHAAKRAREVGIRKAIGSNRRQLIQQFFSESYLVVAFSFILACLLATILLPWFNKLAAKEMYIPWRHLSFWWISLGFIFITGLLAGSYPALYLSSFKPIKVLKGTFRVGRFAAIPRKALVVTQFTISVALIISTLVVQRQVQFAKDRPVGYTREGLIMIEIKSADFREKKELLRTALLSSGVVEEVSGSMGKVTEVASGNDGFDWTGRNNSQRESFGTLTVTPEHGKTVGWQFIAGRDFSSQLASDSAAVVINEAAVNYMGIPNPVGETITWKWRDTPPRPYKIVGIIRNMVMESPYEPIEPTLFFIKAPNGGVSWLNIRLKPGIPLNQSLTKTAAVFKKLIPAVPFDYKWVDEEYAVKFATEERIGKLAAFFAILAVFISCLGLFGLSAFIAEQRTKEIGIRKVLGASVYNLWRLLSSEFVLLVIISLLIAIPIAYYCMNNWLQQYQYRTALSWWIFAAAAISALLITLLTVSFQSIRAAMINPVKSLRSE